MNTRRLAWLGLVGLVGGVSGFVAACGSSGDATTTQTGGSTGSGTTGECGDGTVDSGEQCDLGAENGTGNCTEECRLPICGDGLVNGEEDCDDGNFNNNDSCTNACINNPNLLCGNGEEDAGEECDDGNSTNNDGCTNFCTLPVCGDGIVQAGEDCDDGNNEIADVCPDDCQLETSGGAGGAGGGGSTGPGFGGGPIDCSNAETFAGVVHATDENVAQSVGAVWSFGGFNGVQGGNQACAQDGYDHVCTFEEVEAARTKGELTGLYAMLAGTNRSFWLHRVTTVEVGGQNRTPGAGARCNDWTYPTGHIADGEYATVSAAGAITYVIDTDSAYTGISGQHNGSPFVTLTGTTSGTAGTGSCGTTRAILCCNPVCGEVGQ